jgi:hypothetical protein
MVIQTNLSILLVAFLHGLWHNLIADDGNIGVCKVEKITLCLLPARHCNDFSPEKIHVSPAIASQSEDTPHSKILFYCIALSGRGFQS